MNFLRKIIYLSLLCLLTLMGCLKEIQRPDTTDKMIEYAEDEQYNLLVNNHIADVIYLYCQDSLLKEIPADTVYRIDIPGSPGDLIAVKTWRMNNILNPFIPHPDSLYRMWNTQLPAVQDTINSLLWILHQEKPHIGIGTIEIRQQSADFSVDVNISGNGFTETISLPPASGLKSIGMDYGLYDLRYSYWKPDSTLVNGKKIYSQVGTDSLGMPLQITLNQQNERHILEIEDFIPNEKMGLQGNLTIRNNSSKTVRLFANDELLEKSLLSDQSTEGLSLLPAGDSRSFILGSGVYHLAAKDLSARTVDRFDSCSVIAAYDTRWVITNERNLHKIRNQTQTPVTLHNFDNHQYLGYWLSPHKTHYVHIDTSIHFLTVLSTSSQQGAAHVNPDITWNITALNTDYIPPDSIRNLEWHSSDATTVMRWEAPADDDYDGVEIYRSSFPITGELLDSSLVYRGDTIRYVDTALENYHTYYYLLFPLDISGNRGCAQALKMKPAPESEAPASVENIEVSHATHTISLQWSIPNDIDLAGTRIIRNRYHFPDSPEDGVLVYEGQNHQYTDRNLVNGQKYHYSLFTFDYARNFSYGNGICAVASEDQTPPENVLKPNISQSHNTLVITWQLPFDQDIDGVRLLLNHHHFANHPRDGYIVCNRHTSSCHIQDYNANKPYFFTIYTYDKALNYSSGLQLSPTASHSTEQLPAIENVTFQPGDRKIRISWRYPQSNQVLGVHIFRSMLSYPTGTIDEELIFAGADTTFTDSGIPNYKPVYYSLFAYDISGMHSQAVHLQISAQPDKTPPSEIHSLDVVPGPGTLKFQWQNPVDKDFLGTKILRKLHSSPMNYIDGDLLFNDTLAAFIDRGLVNDQRYYYRFFSYDSSGNYNAGVSFAGTAGFDSIAAPEVHQTAIMQGPGFLELSWQNPSDPDFAGVVICRSVSSYPLSVDMGMQIYSGADSSFLDSGLEGDTDYYYSIFSYDHSHNYSNGIRVIGRPFIDNTPPGNVENVRVSHAYRYITLEWSNPDDNDLAGIRIIRRGDRFASEPEDGNIIYEGLDTHFEDDRQSGATYYYSIYTYDHARNFSSGVKVPVYHGE